MALSKCNECGGPVSTKAAACPGCGAKMPKRTSVFTWVAAVALVGVVGSCVIGTNESNQARQTENAAKVAVEAAKSPEQRAAEAAASAKETADFQFAVRATKAVKAALKNPASFELVSAGLVANGPLCLRYRGTNSFNAVITQTTVVKRDGKIGNWDSDCAGKSAKDMGLIRHAM